MHVEIYFDNDECLWEKNDWVSGEMSPDSSNHLPLSQIPAALCQGGDYILKA